MLCVLPEAGGVDALEFAVAHLSRAFRFLATLPPVTLQHLLSTQDSDGVEDLDAAEVTTVLGEGTTQVESNIRRTKSCTEGERDRSGQRQVFLGGCLGLRGGAGWVSVGG